MKIMAMETSTSMGGIALLDGDRILEEVVAVMGGRHSMRLLEEAHRILNVHNLAIQDMDLFVASLGPGSFTGLRVGLATIKGLAYACGKPAAGVSSLETLAWPLRWSSSLVVPCLDARKGEIYAAVFGADNKGQLSPLTDEMVLSPESLAQKVRALSDGLSGDGFAESILLLGDGALLYRDRLAAELPGRPRFLGGEYAHPRPAVAAKLGRLALERGAECCPHQLDANYIRPSDAELKVSQPLTLVTP